MSFNKFFFKNARAGLCATSILLVGFSSQVCIANPESLHAREGKAAFEAKQYDAALDHFLAASKTEQNSASLQYNIAVCYFRLKQYSNAEQYFQALAQHKKWSGLAHYNLGLVAEAQSKHATAKQWYQKSVNSNHEKLQKLSAAKLERYKNAQTDQQSTKKSSSAFTGILAVKMGEDSNAASLGDELISSQSAAADRYTELLGFGQLYLNGKPRDGLKLYGLAFVRQFSDFDHLNSQVLGVGASYERPLGQFVMEAGARWTNTQINGDALANQLQGKWAFSHYSQAHTWSAAYLPSRYFAGDRFQQIDGLQHRFELQHQWKKNTLKVKSRYRFELNDREDLQTEERFASYSPTRQNFRVEGEWLLYRNTSLKAGWEWTKSVYDGTNTMRDTSGEVTERQRESDQWRWLIGAEYKINKTWGINAEYKHTENNDNFDLYDYSKNEMWVSMGLRF